MIHGRLLLAGLVFAPVLLVAQEAGTASLSPTSISQVTETDQSATLLLKGPGSSSSCPVDFRARQGGFGGMVKVHHGPEHGSALGTGVRQRLGLTIASSAPSEKGERIVRATVTARGLSARAHTATTEAETGPGNIYRTLVVSFTVDADGALSSEITLPGFSAVRSVKLEALEYADGSKHAFADRALCRVQPDPLMLVAGR